MRIIKVEWKNFGSYGNRKQTLEFPENASLFQIFGTNGMGKTTISQVITFCLYGKVEGKNLKDIPNRINGHAWTRIEFESNNRIITVERGLEPSVFNLSIDGVPYEQSGKSNVQEYLSEDLIGIPYYVFNNTISLSINDFKSFIKMKPEDKRAIIDKIFGFHILNQMRERLKIENKKIKEDLSKLTGSLEATKKSLLQSNSEMEILLEKIESDSKEQLVQMNESLLKFKELQVIHSEKVLRFKEDESNLSKLLIDSTKVVIESRSQYHEIERKLSLYDSDKCPTCESSLCTEFHESLKESLNKEKESKFLEFTSQEKFLEELKEREKSLRLTRSDLQEKGSKIQIKINEILREIQKLESTDKNDQVASLKRIVEKLENDQNVLNSEIFKTEEKNSWIKRIDDILGDKGVKQMAIKTILPSLNSEIKSSGEIFSSISSLT